jgi:predicted dehydrogenase
MRTAIVGAGRQARRRASAIAASPSSHVAVVTAVPMTSAVELAHEAQADVTADWSAAVERRDVDAVLVCTPPDMHAEIAITALRAGKHVLCEKPLARSSEEGQRMVDEARAAGRVLWCGFNHRYHPAVRQVRAWLDGGEVGDAMYIRSRPRGWWSVNGTGDSPRGPCPMVSR